MLEYQLYTQRHALTTPFAPSEAEQTLYEHISAYLQRDFSYGFPQQQKHLVALVLRKLLDTLRIDEDWLEHLLDEDDLETDLLDAAENETQPAAGSARAAEPAAVDFALLKAELAELDQYLALAAQVHEDEKSHV